MYKARFSSGTFFNTTGFCRNHLYRKWPKSVSGLHFHVFHVDKRRLAQSQEAPIRRLLDGVGQRGLQEGRHLWCHRRRERRALARARVGPRLGEEDPQITDLRLRRQPAGNNRRSDEGHPIAGGETGLIEQASENRRVAREDHLLSLGVEAEPTQLTELSGRERMTLEGNEFIHGVSYLSHHPLTISEVRRPKSPVFTLIYECLF